STQPYRQPIIPLAVVVEEKRVRSKVGSEAGLGDRRVEQLSRHARQPLRVDDIVSNNRCRADDSIVAAGLVRVVESLVVEGLVAGDPVVRSSALRGLEVRGL